MGETRDYIESSIAAGDCDPSGEIFYDFDELDDELDDDELVGPAECRAEAIVYAALADAQQSGA